MAHHQRGMKVRGRDPGELHPESEEERETTALQWQARSGASERQERTEGNQKEGFFLKKLNTPFLSFWGLMQNGKWPVRSVVPALKFYRLPLCLSFPFLSQF